MNHSQDIPRIESLTVKNYRALRHLELKNLTPLTVLLGPNGSGKSTVFDVFAFLSECFSQGLRSAWNQRNRFKELRTRNTSGPIEFEIKYREHLINRLVTYHLAVDENEMGPVVAEEWLAWRRGSHGKPFRFLDFKLGQGRVFSGEKPNEPGTRNEEQLSNPAVLAVNTLGLLARYPILFRLRVFITSWYLSYISADNTRVLPETGPQERLSRTGDNLPNVIQYLREQHPERLKNILEILSARVPRLEEVKAETTIDGRLVLQIRDAPFKDPILAKYASDGTLKMLAYLTVLHDPDPPKLIGIEEPENQLHPRLLQGLAEECRQTSAKTQLMVTTHSPDFVDGLKPQEVWVLFRDGKGYTHTRRASEMQGIREFQEEGALLGSLWMEGYFDAGDPLTDSGGIKQERLI